MGMEILTLPWMELFFGEDAGRFRLHHFLGLLWSLPAFCQGDEFQEEIYRHTDWSPERRNACWLQMEKKYRPWREYGDLRHTRSGRGWQRLRHFYKFPFYLVDYGLALTCALQIWRQSLENTQQALTNYLALCRLGGSLSFLELLKAGHLESPFTPGVVSTMSAHVKTWLGRQTWN